MNLLMIEDSIYAWWFLDNNFQEIPGIPELSGSDRRMLRNAIYLETKERAEKAVRSMYRK